MTLYLVYCALSVNSSLWIARVCSWAFPDSEKISIKCGVLCRYLTGTDQFMRKFMSCRWDCKNAGASALRLWIGWCLAYYVMQSGKLSSCETTWSNRAQHRSTSRLKLLHLQRCTLVTIENGIDNGCKNGWTCDQENKSLLENLTEMKHPQDQDTPTVLKQSGKVTAAPKDYCALMLRTRPTEIWI